MGSPIDLGPLVGYLVWIVVLFLALAAVAGYRMGKARNASPAATQAPTLVMDGVLDADSAWASTAGDELPILRELFMVVGSAVAGHRLPQVSRLITPTLYQSLMVAESQTQAAAVQIAVTVHEMDVIARAADGSYIAMHFKSTGTRPDGTSVNLSGAWKFEHQAGAGTPAGQEALRCSNCGAPLGDTPTGVCAYCHQVVVGDTNGWLVAAIEPDADVRFTGPQPSFGLFGPQIADP